MLRRKVVTEPYCPICENEPETVLHALWSYPTAVDDWGNSTKSIQKYSSAGRNFICIAEDILKKGGQEDFGSFVQIARQVWYKRNKWVHECIFINPNTVLKNTEEQLENYKRLHEKGPPSERSETPDRVNKWIVPSQGWYKANWDVAIDNSKARVGIGVILRDDRGQMLAAMSKTRNGTLEPSTGEAFAASFAVCFCRDLGVQRVVLEGDAK
jgi:hypothetical protein